MSSQKVFETVREAIAVALQQAKIWHMTMNAIIPGVLHLLSAHAAIVAKAAAATAEAEAVAATAEAKAATTETKAATAKAAAVATAKAAAATAKAEAAMATMKEEAAAIAVKIAAATAKAEDTAKTAASKVISAHNQTIVLIPAIVATRGDSMHPFKVKNLTEWLTRTGDAIALSSQSLKLVLDAPSTERTKAVSDAKVNVTILIQVLTRALDAAEQLEDASKRLEDIA